MNQIPSQRPDASAKVKFRTPSWKRYNALRPQFSSQSILRCLEYERLADLALTGMVLDFGGGRRTNYSDKVKSWGGDFTYESANIDPVTEPTFLISPEGEIPCEPERYDSVISLNTFEHIYDVSGTLDRIRRVLKPGGELLFIVPFLFRVHGHPDDYTRGTPSFWQRMLGERGYGEIEIEALNWGPHSTALTVAGTVGPFKKLRLHFALVLDLLYYSSKYGQDAVIVEDQEAPVCNASFGYFIRCVKTT